MLLTEWIYSCGASVQRRFNGLTASGMILPTIKYDRWSQERPLRDFIFVPEQYCSPDHHVAALRSEFADIRPIQKNIWCTTEVMAVTAYGVPIAGRHESSQTRQSQPVPELPRGVMARDTMTVISSHGRLENVTAKQFHRLNTRKPTYLGLGIITVEKTWWHNPGNNTANTASARTVKCWVTNLVDAYYPEFSAVGGDLDSAIANTTARWYDHSNAVPSPEDATEDGQYNPIARQMATIKTVAVKPIREEQLNEFANKELIKKAPSYTKLAKVKGDLDRQTATLNQVKNDLEYRRQRSTQLAAEIVRLQRHIQEHTRGIQEVDKLIESSMPQIVELETTVLKLEAVKTETLTKCLEEKNPEAKSSLKTFLDAHKITISKIVPDGERLAEVEMAINERFKVNCFDGSTVKYQVWAGPIRVRIYAQGGSSGINVAYLSKDSIMSTQCYRLHPHQSQSNWSSQQSGSWQNCCAGATQANLGKVMGQGSLYESVLMIWSWLTTTDLRDSYGSSAVRFPRVKAVVKPVEETVVATSATEIVEAPPQVIAPARPQSNPSFVPPSAPGPVHVQAAPIPANPNNYVPVRRNTQQVEQE